MSRRKRSTKGKIAVTALPVVRPKVAGVDIGSSELWVCGPALANGEPNVQVFGVTTAQLEELADWLLEQQVESVAMESTSVYWIPLYEVLESKGLEVVLVNARQLHNVPGRKTDMQDCQWLQLLHSCGLLRGSFRPHESICRLRALNRQLGNLVAERSKAIQWMQKALDQMNVLVHRAVADLTGTTGLSIVRHIVAGERDPRNLAQLRDARCRKSIDEIAEYLTGTWRDEHLFNLKSALSLYDHLSEQINEYEAQLQRELKALQPLDRCEQSVAPHPNAAKHKAMKRRGELSLRADLCRLAQVDLTRIDGVSVSTALVVLTEVGLDLSAFPSEAKFVSWLRLSPRTPVSGGKPLRKKPNGLGATRVAAALRMAALTLGRSRTALGAAYRRVARRKDGKVAVFATARKLAQLIYRMLRFGTDYLDVGAEAYEARFRQRKLAAMASSANELGYDLVPIPQPG
jgi:transposase